VEWATDGRDEFRPRAEQRARVAKSIIANWILDLITPLYLAPSLPIEPTHSIYSPDDVLEIKINLKITVSQAWTPQNKYRRRRLSWKSN
jgi:predicted transglutaminase-like protease